MINYNYSNIFRLDKSIHCSESGSWGPIDIGAVISPLAYSNNLFTDKEGSELIKISYNIGLIKNFDQFLSSQIKIDFNTQQLLVENVHRNNNREAFKSNKNSNLNKIYLGQEAYLPNLTNYSHLPKELNYYDDSNLINDLIKEEIFENSFFYLNNIFVSHNDLYTCPLRTFAIFTHNETLNEKDYQILYQFKTCINRENLDLYLDKNLQYEIIKDENINKSKDDNLVEFNPISQKESNLKLVCWVDIKNISSHLINLSNFTHSGKYIIVKMLNTNCICQVSIDVSKILLFGQMVTLEINKYN